jgi:hypothetical protein
MTTDIAQPRARRRRLWIPLATAALVLGGLFAFVRVGAAMREAAIDRIKMANQPLLPIDLKPAHDRKGKDPAEWLARVNDVRNTWEMHDLTDATSYHKLLERSARRDFGDDERALFGEDARVAFAELEICIEKLIEGEKDSAAVWNSFWGALDGLLRQSNGSSDWGACPEKALRVLALGLEKSMKLAREGREYGPVDPQVVARLLDKENESFPSLPVVQEARIADAVQVWALHDAQSKRFATALDDVRAGLDVARIHQPSYWLVSHVLWVLHMGRTLDALEAVLPLLPRGLDVSDIEATLSAARPRDELAFALVSERAFTNRVFEHMREGWSPPEGTALHASFVERWRWRLVGDRDQAAYLDAMTHAIERAAKPRVLRAPEDEPSRSAWWHPIATMITPTLEAHLTAADALEARLALARAALTAYRAGAADTFKFLKDSHDPFDGRPLRCAFGTGAQEGLVVFWSVGPDGNDDGGTDPTKDIVWRLKLK